MTGLPTARAWSIECVVEADPFTADQPNGITQRVLHDSEAANRVVVGTHHWSRIAEPLIVRERIAQASIAKQIRVQRMLRMASGICL
jgi:hypothetical protein